MSYNHFDYVPSGISKSRSVFKFEKAIAGGCEIGFLYPMCKPIAMLPGSSLKLDLAMEVRSGALIAPLQDELLLDVFAFNVPNRIVWEHWKQFVGATDDVLFDSLTDYQIPSFKYDPLAGSYENSLGYTASHLLAIWHELPFVDIDSSGTGYQAIRVSALMNRGYNFIWNENFRPEQLVNPILFSKTDNGYSGDNITHSWYDGTISIGGTSNIIPIVPTAGSTDTECSGGCVLPTFRVHKSLWTSCLPKPSLETLNLLGDLSAPVGFVNTESSTVSAFTTLGLSNGAAVPVDKFGAINATGLTSQPGIIADLSQAILTVNNYRETIMLQNYYDALNRAGSRYDEIIRNIFHTQTSNGVIDIPELIVHKRFTIFRKTVVAQAESVDGSGNTTFLGSQAGYIDTVVKDSFFTTSTTEHGYVHPLFTIRPARIRMAQGIEPDWTKLNKFDMYYPQFDGMGDVPRYKNELFIPSVPTATTNAAIFGYQEYGAEYKYQRNSAVGWCDPNITGHIAGLTLCEKLGSQPSLASVTNFGYMGYLSCLVEEQAFASCLAVSSPAVAPQFIVDIRLTGEIVHPMPVYNIPGMGDLL